MDSAPWQKLVDLGGAGQGRDGGFGTDRRSRRSGAGGQCRHHTASLPTGCASRSAAILYGSVLHARLTPRLWFGWSGFDRVRQDEGRHGAVGEVDAVRGDVAAL
jgi:hypothetical protein